jgi:transcriptional regulator with GAF, ATPase, and Fis domain
VNVQFDNSLVVSKITPELRERATLYAQRASRKSREQSEDIVAEALIKTMRWKGEIRELAPVLYHCVRLLVRGKSYKEFVSHSPVLVELETEAMRGQYEECTPSHYLGPVITDENLFEVYLSEAGRGVSRRRVFAEELTAGQAIALAKRREYIARMREHDEKWRAFREGH